MRMWLLNYPWAAKLCQQWWIKWMDPSKLPVYLGLELSQGAQCKGTVIKKTVKYKNMNYKSCFCYVSFNKRFWAICLCWLCVALILPLLQWTTDQESIHFWVIIKTSQWLRNWEKNEQEFGVWDVQCGGLRSLVVYDTFEAHLNEKVKAVLTKGNTNLGVIPYRLTSALKPLFLE